MLTISVELDRFKRERRNISSCSELLDELLNDVYVIHVDSREHVHIENYG